MAVEELDEKKKAIKEIYNHSVRLLELLNVLIPQVDTYKPEVKIEIVQEIADKCFELGAQLSENIEELTNKDTNDEEDWYPCGI